LIDGKWIQHHPQCDSMSVHVVHQKKINHPNPWQINNMLDSSSITVQ
jgi:hypothetical protein